MSCSSCSRRTLSLFIRSFVYAEVYLPRNSATLKPLRSARLFSAAPRPGSQRAPAAPTYAETKSKPTRRFNHRREELADQAKPKSARVGLPQRSNKDRESWQVQKAALKEKLGGEAWNPRKKLSPDTMEGIRHLHQSAPDRFTSAVLAQHFKVSPEAIRRILKSKWQPSDEEQEERLKRWDKRGETIWSNLVELGVKPPKRWREMGVGRAAPGTRPTWKSRSRNTVAVQDSFSEDLIPIVEKGSDSARRVQEETPFTERLV